MTSIELAQRLVGDLDEKDLSLVSANTRTALLDAMNAAIQEVQAASPPHWKEVLSSVTLKAPETVTIDVIEGSSEFGGLVINEDMLHCSIRIDGDPIIHQIIDTGELLDDYSGTTGTKNATIYYDAFAVPEPIERFASDPWLVETKRKLYRMSDPDLMECRGRTVGMPRTYTMEANAQNNNAAAPVVVRVDSLPDKAYRLRVKSQMGPLKLTYEDLITARQLPVRADIVEAYVKPMARRALSSSPLWKNKETISDAKDRGDKAEAKLHVYAQNTMGQQSNQVGTPQGY